MKRMIAATLMFSLLLSATACGKAPFKSFLLGRACPKPCQERVRQTGIYPDKVLICRSRQKCLSNNLPGSILNE